MSLQTHITAPPELSSSLRDQLFDLFHASFDNTTRERFEQDLDNKHWVILVMDHHKVVGFTTAELLTLEHDGEEQRFLYSGDTMVDPEHWNQPALPAAFGHLMLDLVDRSPVPLYWFLVSKGFRTYRLLPANFKHFIPDCRRRSDAVMARRLNAVARAKFGERYHAETGIIDAGAHTEHLKSELQSYVDGRRRNPHIFFFLEKNPGWRRGDELACLTLCHRDNLTRLALRQLDSVKPIWKCR